MPGGGCDSIVQAVSSKPRFNWFKKTLAAGLISGLMGTGVLASASSKNQEIRNPAAQTELSRAKTLILNPKLPTQQEMYESYMQQGAEYSQKEGDENRQKAIEYFAKAITLDMNKSLMLKTENMDPNARTIFTNTLRAAQFSKMMAEEKEKNKKSNSWMYWVGGAVAAAGLGYLIYTLTKKDEPPPPPPPVQVTINYDVFNHTKKGVLTSFSKTYTAGSQATLSISDITGISGVDSTHITLREDSINKRVGKKIAFDKSSGTVTFTAPSASVSYDIFLLNDTGQYDKIDAWIDKGGGKLDYPRNCTYNRKDKNNETGPEQPILDSISQFNNALDSGEIDLGDITKVDSGGNIEIGYYGDATSTSPGYHGGNFAGINRAACDKAGLAYKLVFTDEIDETLNAVDDIAGDGTTGNLICNRQGNLNQVGIDLLCYVYVKDDALDNQVSSNANAALQALSNVKARIGGVDVGFSGKRLSADYQGKSVGVSTEFGLEDKGLSANTRASFSGKGFSASLAARLSPDEEAYFASELNASLGKKDNPVEVGVRGSYAAASKDNSFGFSLRKKGIGVSFDRSTIGENVTSSAALQTSFKIGDKNTVALSGAIVDSSGAVKRNSLAIGANANLDGLLDGLSINAGYGRNAYGPVNLSSAYIGVAQRIGPGLLNLSIVDWAGMPANCTVTYGFCKAF